jgi:hypothetical protein
MSKVKVVKVWFYNIFVESIRRGLVTVAGNGPQHPIISTNRSLWLRVFYLYLNCCCFDFAQFFLEHFA